MLAVPTTLTLSINTEQHRSVPDYDHPLVLEAACSGDPGAPDRQSLSTEFHRVPCSRKVHISSSTARRLCSQTAKITVDSYYHCIGRKHPLDCTHSVHATRIEPPSNSNGETLQDHCAHRCSLPCSRPPVRSRRVSALHHPALGVIFASCSCVLSVGQTSSEASTQQPSRRDAPPLR